MSKHVVIIGGGPAGLMAAEQLAGAGLRVTLYDHMPSLGRKFLMAGRGGLNLTHSEPLPQFLTRYGAAEDWLASSIHAFTPQQLRDWCEGLGQETFIGSSGRVFPRSMKAAPLLRAWLRRLAQLGVEYKPHHHWQGWSGAAQVFTDALGQTVQVRPDATLLALGGASWPRLGSDGGWASLLAEAGITISPLRPVNCGFTVHWSEHFIARFAGTPLKPVLLTHRGHSRQGEVMITAHGIEGGAVYALSSSLRDAIERDGHAVLHMNLRPGMTQEALLKKLSTPRSSQSFSTYLRKAGFSPEIAGLLREASPTIAQLRPAELLPYICGFPLLLTGTTGLARAISTAGGITREAVDEYFMLQAKPGVFVAGEMLDWEAPTGGYLLQACFSTAVTAAQGIKNYLR